MTSCSSILSKSELDKGVKRGIRLGSVSVSGKQLVSHRSSRVGATRLWRIGACVFLIIVFEVVNRVFLMVVSEMVNRVPHVVHLLVLNPGRAIKKISPKARKSRRGCELWC